MKMVADFLRDFFGFTNPSIERAHRDGPKIRNLPRHLLVKMLSFQDKKYIVSQQRKKLEKEKMYIVDDLTKKDREEKKTWQTQVQHAFRAGTRYHFSAGKWRDGRGMPAAFYTAATGPGHTDRGPLGSEHPSGNKSPQSDNAPAALYTAATGTGHTDRGPVGSELPTGRKSPQSDHVPPRLTRVVEADVHAEQLIRIIT